MLSLGAAKLLGILFESLGYGESSAFVFVPHAYLHRSLPRLHERCIPCDVRVQYVYANAQPLGQECKASQRAYVCRLDASVRGNYHRELPLEGAVSGIIVSSIPSWPKRWAIGVARIYEAVVDLEGQVPLSKYFADITLKKQIVVTGLLEFHVIVADLILVSRSALRHSAPYVGYRYIAYITSGSPTGGFALFPPCRGSASGVSYPVYAGKQESDRCVKYLVAF